MTPIKLITKIASEASGFSVSELRGPCKTKRLSFIRLRIYVAAYNQGYSLQEIGDYLGGRHHTTILHGIRRVLS